MKQPTSSCFLALRQVNIISQTLLMKPTLFLQTMGIPKSGVDASLNMVGKGPGGTSFSFTIDRQVLSGVYGKNVKIPSGFEGTITLDIFSYDKHVFGNYSSVSIVVYAVKPSGDVLLGAEHLMFDSNPRVKSLARRYNVDMSASQEVQSKNLSSAPYFYFRATLADNGVFPRSGNPAQSPGMLICRFFSTVTKFLIRTC